MKLVIQKENDEMNAQMTSSKFFEQHFSEFISYLRENGLHELPRGIDGKIWWSMFCAEKFANEAGDSKGK